MSKISIIVAASDNMVIGKGNDLPWNLPSDLKYFKNTTAGKTVIMGKLCWLSIPEKFRPLPGRTNIVLSRDKKYEPKGATLSNNIEECLSSFKNNGDDEEVFVIGGAQIYKEAFKYADKLYITRVHASVEGDVFLEGFNTDEWDWESESRTIEENNFRFRFETYNRKKTK